MFGGFHWVPTPPELIETNIYLLKESRVIGAIGISSPAITKRPDSRGFQMSNMYGRTEEVFGKSYDKGQHVCHGAGGGADWNLFPQLNTILVPSLAEPVLDPSSHRLHGGFGGKYLWSKGGLHD